jgi:hypothetical protein
LKKHVFDEHAKKYKRWGLLLVQNIIEIKIKEYRRWELLLVQKK